MRLNLGSGEYPMHGWTNVDLIIPADVKGDIRTLEFSDVEMVNMSHLLEHLPHTQTISVLKRIHSWMQPDAPITIEVPDMDAICQLGVQHRWFQYYVYGNQANEGEVHRAGFNADKLMLDMQMAGFDNVRARSFLSQHPERLEMPVLEAKARA